MQIEFLPVGDATVVRLEGRFVAGSDTEYLRTKEVLGKSASKKVVVDCREVPYLDSTALNFIVGLYTTVINGGGSLVVCGVNPRMTEVLRITHLDEIIPVYADRGTALIGVSKPREHRCRARDE
jgi:anti-anti-sigma factor